MIALFDIRHVTFAHPLFFILLGCIPLYLYLQRKQKNNQAGFLISSHNIFRNIPIARMNYWRWVIPTLRVITLLAFTIALARPQSSQVNETVNSEGIDIILSMDISGSMLAQDFIPNRIEAAKKVADNFVQHRITDRIGLVIFSGESFTQCPLTTDQQIIREQLKNIRSGLLEDGTAIGMGLATAVDRLRNSKAKSKVIVLLTDGVNNAGLIDPITALEIAKAYQIKVYTIGIGSEGSAPYPVQDAFGNTQMQQMPVQIDEPLMQRISKETGGKYYRAKDNDALQKIYADIDKLEKTRIEMSSFTQYAELFFPFAMLGLASFIIEIILHYSVFRKLP